MFPDFTRNSGIFPSSASRVVASPIGLPMMPPTETTPSCWVRRLKPSMAAVVFVDWSSATTRLSLPPLPAPLHAARPVDLVHRERRPGAYLEAPGREVAPVSGVSTPILIGLPCADPLDPPYALDPLSTAVNIATAPTAAINLKRFTTSLLPSCLPTTRLTTTRRCRPDEPVNLEPTSCPSISPTTHLLWLLREPRDSSQRLDESVARTSAHVYNTRCGGVQQAPGRAGWHLRLHTSAVRLRLDPATKGT